MPNTEPDWVNYMTPTETTEPIPSYTTGWRLATIICLVILAVAAASGVGMYEMFNAQIGHLQAKLKNVPQTKYIAVLLDAQQAPGVLVTFDPQDGFLHLAIWKTGVYICANHRRLADQEKITSIERMAHSNSKPYALSTKLII